MGIAADFVLIVIAGLLGGALARFLRLPLLVGYVLAGIFVGPHTAGPTVVEIHDIEMLAEIGVALLLFSLGLEVSIGDLQPVKRLALIGGPLQILLIMLLGGAAVSFGLGLAPVESAWFGAMISVSSTMVVVKILSEAGVTSTLASRLMIGLLVVQDLAVIPMLIILPELNNSDGVAAKLLRSVPLAAAVLAAVYFLGTRWLPGMLRLVLTWGSRELFLVAVVATGVGVGYAAHLAGISFALGAFVAGIILSESEFSHQALSDIGPLRDIFGLLFFVTVGMLFEPVFVLANPGRTLLVVALIVAGKALVIGGVTRAFGYVNLAPWIVGLGLSQVGEFSFVLARAGLASQGISKQTYDLILTATVVTMALSPLISRAALPLGRWWRSRTGAARTAPESVVLPGPEDNHHVVVAGYGRTGRAVARSLRAAGIPCLIVELNHPLYTDLIQDGFSGVWGDVTRPEILHAAQIDRASMLLITIPDVDTVRLAAGRARHANPALALIVRATRARQLPELAALGATAAVQPEFEGGVEMGRQALLHCHVEAEAVTRIVDQLRGELYSTSQQEDR